MVDKTYLTKDDLGREVFDVRAYEDDMQMKELARMRKEKEQRRVSSQGLKSKIARFFGFQKTI